MLTGKVIVVTGGAGLLGREFVLEIAKKGGIAIIGEKNLTLAKKIQSEINSKKLPGKVIVKELDITSKESVVSLISYLNLTFSRIDALVNNAYPRNKNYGKKLLDVEYDDFCENLGWNLGGYFLCSQQFSKFFLKQGYGNIINISSIYGVIAPRFDIYEGTAMTMPVEYAAIKSGLIHLTKYFAKYLKGNNIRVNTIAVGGIKDGQPESFLLAYKNYCINKGMLDPCDISGTLVFLLSDLASNLNGQLISVDDGFTI